MNTFIIVCRYLSQLTFFRRIFQPDIGKVSPPLHKSFNVTIRRTFGDEVILKPSYGRICPVEGAHQHVRLGFCDVKGCTEGLVPHAVYNAVT